MGCRIEVYRWSRRTRRPDTGSRCSLAMIKSNAVPAWCESQQSIVNKDLDISSINNRTQAMLAPDFCEQRNCINFDD